MWNEKFTLSDVQDDSSIIIELWDKDWVTSDFIGQTAEIQFSKYSQGNTMETLPLTNTEGQNEGELKIRINKNILGLPTQ